MGWIIGGIIAIGVAAVLADKLTGDWVTPEELDTTGPKFPRRQALGLFQAQGYLREGWPVVVDFEAQPGTLTWLELTFKGWKRPWARIVIPDGERRHTEIVRIPVGATPNYEMWVARYSLHSAILGPDGKLIAGRDGKPVYQPLQVYGIGAGPRAIDPNRSVTMRMPPATFRRVSFQAEGRTRTNSMLLRIDEFAPNPAQRAEDVRFAFFAGRLFDRSMIEVLRLPKSDGKEFKDVKAVPFAPLAAGRHRANWGAMGVRLNPVRGRYHLQARAWLVGGRADERDWIGAMAPNFVQIP